MKNNRTLNFAFLVFLIQLRYKAMPINMYKVVHTGAKIQLGGLKGGLLRCVYQVGIEDMVKKDPITPTNIGKRIETNNFINLF